MTWRKEQAREASKICNFIRYYELRTGYVTESDSRGDQLEVQELKKGVKLPQAVIESTHT